jgi:sugar lactone lactonase YvrE
LGLRFNKKTGELFIADGYFGLMKVAPDGGLAEPVVQEFDGVQFKFLNSLDFDEDGIIYFTDSSSKYYRRFVQYSMIPCIIFAAQARSDGYGLRDWRGSGCQKVFL